MQKFGGGGGRAPNKKFGDERDLAPRSVGVRGGQVPNRKVEEDASQRAWTNPSMNPPGCIHLD